MKDLKEIIQVCGFEFAQIVNELDADVDISLQAANDIDEREIIYFYLIWTTATLEKVKNTVFRAMKSVVGTVQRDSVVVLPAFDRGDMAYYIIDKWRIYDE